MVQSTSTNAGSGTTVTTETSFNSTGGTDTTTSSNGGGSFGISLAGAQNDAAKRLAAQMAYDSAVRNSVKQQNDITARTNITLDQLNLQKTQLPQTLAQLTAQYNQSLSLLNRSQETENATFAPQEQIQAAQQALAQRQFQKQVGQVQASFGARGIAYSETAMGDMMRQNSLLNEIDQSQKTILSLQEQQTGIKQEQARDDLQNQIDNSRLSIQQKLEGVNTEITDQNALEKVLLQNTTPNVKDYGYSTPSIVSSSNYGPGGGGATIIAGANQQYPTAGV